MADIIRMLMCLFLIAGIAGAWIYPPPSCLPQANVAGVNYVYITNNTSYSCINSTDAFFDNIAATSLWGISNDVSTTGPSFNLNSLGGFSHYNDTHFLITQYVDAGASCQGQLRSQAYIPVPQSGAWYATVKQIDRLGAGTAGEVSNGTSSIWMTAGGVLTITATNVSNGTAAVSFIGVQNITLIFNNTVGGGGRANGIGISYLVWPYYPVPGTQTLTVLYSSPSNIWGGCSMNFTDDRSYQSIISSANLTMTSAVYNTSAVFSDGARNTSYIGADKFHLPYTGKYFSALLYYGSYLITPVITTLPAQAEYAAAWRNISSPLALLRNNTLTYVFDGVTHLWYVVPPYQVAQWSDNPSLATFLVQNSTTSGTTPPLLANYIMCNEANGLWTVNSSYSAAVSHQVNFWNSSNANYSTGTGVSFSYSINTSLYPNANYTVNGQLQCVRASGGTLLFPALPPAISQGVRPIMYIIFAASIMLSTMNPFALMFAVAINDWFSIIAIAQMAVLTVAVVVISALANGWGASGLRSMGIYAVVIASILLFYYSYSGASPSAINSLMVSFGNLVTNNDAGWNLISFALATADFIIKLGATILLLPSIVVDAITGPIAILSPPLSSPVAAVAAAIKIGAYIWIFSKIYEIMTKQFPGVM